jgi:predicted aldo/keto reductase-like oxidoreductase
MSAAEAVQMMSFDILVNHTHLDAALERARQNDVGVIAMKVARPVYPGRKRDEGNAEGIASLEKEVKGDWNLPQRAYVWALRNQKLSGVISNMIDSEQVADNVPLPAKVGG